MARNGHYSRLPRPSPFLPRKYPEGVSSKKEFPHCASSTAMSCVLKGAELISRRRIGIVPSEGYADTRRIFKKKGGQRFFQAPTYIEKVQLLIRPAANMPNCDIFLLPHIPGRSLTGLYPETSPGIRPSIRPRTLPLGRESIWVPCQIVHSPMILIMYPLPTPRWRVP